jgi:arsenate reductase
MTSKISLLFLCTGNSCRSQMAEGWARHLKSDLIDVYSAGIETHGLNPFAVTVMAENGVDISMHRSKHVSEFSDKQFDYVVTVCDHANESCPFFPGNTKRIHKGFEDPPRCAEKLDDDEARLNCYRKVCDDIRAFVEMLPDNLND